MKSQFAAMLTGGNLREIFGGEIAAVEQMRAVE